MQLQQETQLQQTALGLTLTWQPLHWVTLKLAQSHMAWLLQLKAPGLQLMEEAPTVLSRRVAQACWQTPPAPAVRRQTLHGGVSEARHWSDPLHPD